MSYCELKVALKEGNVIGYKEYRNAYGGHAYIWDMVYNKYLKKPDQEFGSWLTDSKRLWPLYKDESIPKWVRIVLTSTYDFAIVEYEKLEEIAKLYRKFVKEFPRPGTVCHLLEWAKTIEEILKEYTDKNCAGICFYTTSVSDDLWQVWGEGDKDEDDRLYNLSKDDKHWFVFKELQPKEPK